MARPKALLSWSSGKDSAWALHVLRRTGELDVVGLLTTINETHARVAMHAVRLELLRAQARAAGLPLWEVPIPSPCSNAEYEAAMGAAMARAKAEGIGVVAFGDLFLEDIRRYREEKLAAIGMEPRFPIWGIPTAELAREMIAGGLRARITCVDPKQLDRRFAGEEWSAIVGELPASVDPCGERGEFHTFAFAGPMFAFDLEVVPGQVIERDGFVFADLTSHDAPLEAAAPALPFPDSLCHRCAAPPKYVHTGRSTFILCPISAKKYPPQPVRACPLFRPR